MQKQDTYPVLLVHGTAFRDYPLPLYWGRIPRVLRQHGAQVFCGKTEGWATTQHNGLLLCRRIDAVLAETGAEKLHIIAHSKGGLDARFALAQPGYSEKAASLTTFSTPHRGSRTMDRLLALPLPAWQLTAAAVNALAFLFGDRHPDFLTVCREFSTAHMQRFNAQYPLPQNMALCSVGAKMARCRSDIFMAAAHRLVRRYDGENDGIVGVWSMKWDAAFHMLSAGTQRGISHVDMIDLRRRALDKDAAAPHVADITHVYSTLLCSLRTRERKDL